MVKIGSVKQAKHAIRCLDSMYAKTKDEIFQHLYEVRIYVSITVSGIYLVWAQSEDWNDDFKLYFEPKIELKPG